jgi:MFS family permease
MTVLGSAVAAVPLSRVMNRHGRRPGLVAGSCVGALGAGLFIVATAASWFPLLLVAAFLFGSSTATNLQARYAATDLAPEGHRGRALSLVVWATTIGAVLGPNLIGPGAAVADALGLPELSGPFLFSLAALAMAAIIVFWRLRPDPLLESRRALGIHEAEIPHASLRAGFAAVRGSPRALLGLGAIALSHTVMISVMVMTPVHMRDGGAELEIVGVVISLHIAGMYALSPIVGWLADQVGRIQVIVVSQVILLGAVLIAGHAGAHDTAGLSFGLFLLGLGWSCALIAGSTLLAESVAPASRPLAQGAADFLMGLCGAVGAAASGIVLGWVGYTGLNHASALLVVPVFALVLAAGRLDRRGSVTH